MTKKQVKNDLISENYFFNESLGEIEATKIMRDCSPDYIINKVVLRISKRRFLFESMHRLTDIPLNDPKRVFNFIQLLWEKK